MSNDIGKLTICPRCGLEAKTLLHKFCTQEACPVRNSLPATGQELSAGIPLARLREWADEYCRGGEIQRVLMEHLLERFIVMADEQLTRAPSTVGAMKGRDMDAPEQPCGGCGKPLLIENAWMEDGCPCNTPAGVNNLNLYRWRLLHMLQQRQSRELSDEKRRVAEAAERELQRLSSSIEAPSREQIAQWIDRLIFIGDVAHVEEWNGHPQVEDNGTKACRYIDEVREGLRSLLDRSARESTSNDVQHFPLSEDAVRLLRDWSIIDDEIVPLTLHVDSSGEVSVSQSEYPEEGAAVLCSSTPSSTRNAINKESQ